MRLILSTLAVLLLYSCAQDSISPTTASVADALAEPMRCTISIQNLVHPLEQHLLNYNPFNGWHSQSDTVINYWEFSWQPLRGSFVNRTFTMQDGVNTITMKLSANYSEIESLSIQSHESCTYRTDKEYIIKDSGVEFIAEHLPLSKRDQQRWYYSINGEELVGHIVNFSWSDRTTRYSGNGGLNIDTQYYTSLSPLSTNSESSIVVELTSQNLWQDASVHTMKYDTH